MDGPASPQTTHPSLLIRIRDPHDREAWEAFVDTYGPLAYRSARRLGLQDADAADVGQEVLAEVARCIRSFEYQPDRGRFRDWLGTLVRRRGARFLKKGREAPDPPEDAGAAADPGSAMKQVDVLTGYAMLVGNADLAGRFDEALEWLERDEAWIAAAGREKRLTPGMLAILGRIVDDRRALYRAAGRGLELDGQPVDPSLPPGPLDDWRLLRAVALARRGRHAEADTEARAVVEHPTDDPLRAQAVARVYALCAEAVAREDAAGGDPPAREPGARYLRSAFEALRRSYRLQPASSLDVVGDPGLDPLRRRGLLQLIARELGQGPPPGAAKG